MEWKANCCYIISYLKVKTKYCELVPLLVRNPKDKKSINKKKMKERQLNLQGDVITTSDDITNCDISLDIPLTGIAMLKKFYTGYRNPDGFSANYFYKVFSKRKHINTIRNNLKILKDKELVRLRYRGLGPNHRVSTYVITEIGIKAWHDHLNSLSDNKNDFRN